MNTSDFTELNPEECMALSGGGFAYDVGRIIRWLALGGASATPYGVASATADWIVNDTANEAAQETS
jgi:hypothetical protein